jgi:hypothetical protein
MKNNKQKSFKFILVVLILVVSLSPLTGVKARADEKEKIKEYNNVTRQTVNAETEDFTFHNAH